MPAQTLEEMLTSLLRSYLDKDFKEVEVRNALVKDIVSTLALLEKSKKTGAVMMTPAASMYDPKTDKVPVRPKAV